MTTPSLWLIVMAARETQSQTPHAHWPITSRDANSHKDVAWHTPTK